MTSIISIIQAIEAELKALFGSGGNAFLVAALTAFLTGGWPGLIAYLESLVANPPPGAPPADKIQATIAKFKTKSSVAPTP